MRFRSACLRVCLIATLLAAVTPSLARAQGGPSTAKTWQRWEYVLPTTKNYSTCQPYRNQVLAVTYTSPTGQTYTGYGFWDGADPNNPAQNIFRVRASFPSVGTWRWTTGLSGSCGDDPALRVTNADISVTASGVNTAPIYSQGGLKVNTGSPNPSHYLVHASGVPFYWLGDTAWFSPWLATSGDWTTYLGTYRKPQGFTVIQISMPIGKNSQPQFSHPQFGVQSPFENCTGIVPDTCSDWNELFWREYDRKIKEANNKGFVVVLIGLFKRVIEETPSGAQQTWPSITEAQIYARNAVARFGGDHVIFSPGFDEQPIKTSTCTDSISDPACSRTTAVPAGVNCPGCTTYVNQACRARVIGNQIRNSMVRSTVDGKPLIGLVTHHMGGGCLCSQTPCTADSWLATFHGESWLDFQLFQSGQGGNCELGQGQAPALECLTKRARQRPKDLYNLGTPSVKPNANGEGIYDQFGSPNANYSADRARQVGYLSTLSGAFGYTFGVDGTWDWGTAAPFNTPTQGMTATSATQMKHMCTLFRNFDWQKLIPAEARIFAQSATESKKQVYAHDGTSGGGHFAFAYLPIDSSKPNIDLDTSTLLNFTTNWCEQWFNPRTGSFQNLTPGQIGMVTATRYRFWKPDTSVDWVLVLRDANCWTTPPKVCPCTTVSGGQYVCASPPT